MARLAAKKDGAQERAALEREFALERQKLLAKVKAAESEKEEAMARASAAEQMLVLCSLVVSRFPRKIVDARPI
eukprot:SAG31_NODE_253_length_19063_cov_31.913362_4_plen_74_part_00